MTRISPRNRDRFHKTALGGTFDILHAGHLALLSRAFEISERVLIGVVSDELAMRLRKKHEIRPYAERVHFLTEVIYQSGWSVDRVSILPLRDEYGAAATDADIEAIVVTEETEPNAKRINEIRIKSGIRPLHVEKVQRVLAYDGVPISSSRIRNGEIDSQGKRVG